MTLKRPYFIGTQLICLLHVASSFTMTVNKDDFTDMLQKYVPKPVASYILDLVSQIATHAIKNAPKEDNQYVVDVKHMSDDEINNLGFNNEDTNELIENIAIEDPYAVKDKNNKYKPETYSDWLKKQDKLALKQAKKHIIYKSEARFRDGSSKPNVDGSSKEIGPRFDEITKQSTPNNAKDDVPTTGNSQINKTQRMPRYTYSNNINATQASLKPMSSFDQAPDSYEELTTRRERIEFDQYENPKYPKAPISRV